jgi:alpha-L-fucosidase 2
VSKLLTKSVVGLLSIGLVTQCAYANSYSVKLWYDGPLGNGRLGAMVYGGVQQETIQLNEDTYWAGGPHNNLNLTAKNALPLIRKRLEARDYAGAADLAQKTITSQGSQGMPYQSSR